MSQPFDPTQYTAAHAADPTASAEILEAIAYYRPDLRQIVAANPPVTDQLRQRLASYGVTLDSPAPAQFAPPPAQTAPTQADAAAAPHQWAPGWQSNAAAPAAGSTPPPFPGAAYSGAPTQPIAGPAAYGQGGYPPAYGGAVTANQPRKSRKGVWIGLGVAAAMVVGGGAFAAKQLWFDKVGGAASGQEAAEQFVTSLGNDKGAKDLVALYGSLTPSEYGYLGQVNTVLIDRLVEFGGFKESDVDFDVEEYLDVVTLTSDGLTFSEETLTSSAGGQLDDAVRVVLDGGSVTVDVDQDKAYELAEKAVENLQELDQETGIFGYSDFDDFNEDEFKQEIDDAFPITVTFADDGFEVETADGTESAPVPFSVISVKEGDTWFVSPLLTIADYGLESAGISERGPIADTTAAKGAETPQAAVVAFVENAVGFFDHVDITAIADTLTLPERRLVAFLAPAYEEGIDQLKQQGIDVAVDLGPVSAEEVKQEDGLAWVKVTDIEISAEGGSASLKDDCVTYVDDASGENVSFCIADAPILGEFGVDKLSFVTVKEDSGWFVSAVLTGYDAFGVIGGNAMRLQAEGKLTEEWLSDPANLGVLADLGIGSSSGYDLDDYYDDTYEDDTYDDDTYDDYTYGEWTPEQEESLLTDLQNARVAVADYLVQNPDAAEYEVYDALYELETSSEDNYVYLFSYSEDAGDFCVAGWLWSASLDRSIDAAGVVYEDAYCGS